MPSSVAPAPAAAPAAGPSPAPAAPSPAAPEASRPSNDPYGIRRAIELLRRLPPGERALLVEVVKMTLESVNVHVATIVDDANRRETEIDRRIAVLRREVNEREEEISTRRTEIANLELEQNEISRVKQQLSAVPEHAAAPTAVKAPANGDPARSLTVVKTS